MSIPKKIGMCIGCGNVTYLTAKRCNNCYWPYRNKVNAEKPRKQQKNSVIPQKSDNQLQRDIAYAKARKAWMPFHPICEAKLDKCTGIAIEVHHRAGRSGRALLDTENWLAVCRNCHQWITEHSAESIKMGLSLKRNT